MSAPRVPRAAWRQHAESLHVVPPRCVKEHAILALGLGSPPAPLTSCRVHQRAWVAFHVPTRDGSPGTDAPCDRYAAGPQRVEGVGGDDG